MFFFLCCKAVNTSCIHTLTHIHTHTHTHIPKGTTECCNDNDTVFALGYGAVNRKATQFSDVLKGVSLKYMSREQCLEYIPILPITHICTHATYNASICAGDSGGPLLHTNGQTQIGKFISVFSVFLFLCVCVCVCVLVFCIAQIRNSQIIFDIVICNVFSSQFYAHNQITTKIKKDLSVSVS